MTLPASCALFIRSYWRDLGWLALCLASVERFCHGFTETVVVLPRSSQSWLRRTRLPSFARVELCDVYHDDYLGQQITKLHADEFTTADFVCYVDADCVFTTPTSPADFIVDGRARVEKRPIDTLPRERPWVRPTETFLGWPVQFDFMCHPPFTYPRWLLGRVRQHAVRTHRMALDVYIASQPPRGFSEFNVLGAFAWERCRDAFVWEEAEQLSPADRHCRWYWSWGGLDRSTLAEIRSIVARPSREP
jgi:hypothetical protein